MNATRSKGRNAPQGPSPFAVQAEPLAAGKFTDPLRTAEGVDRASVTLSRLVTLWFNTGTLCNLACASCYIESSPTNDALQYLTAGEVARFLDEIGCSSDPQIGGVEEIGFTGGEPFMNPRIIAMIGDALERGFRVIVLSNAMKPMQRHADALLALRQAHGDRLAIRVSMDHHTPDLHEAERGAHTWAPMLEGLAWLAANGFAIAVAGRIVAGETMAQARDGYAALFARQGIPLDAHDPHRLVLFPAMDEGADVPEITTACWTILGKRPDDIMCASSRMVVHRKGEEEARIVACTLLPYDRRFDLGDRLESMGRTVALNHPHCARFCVLGGASCSA